MEGKIMPSLNDDMAERNNDDMAERSKAKPSVKDSDTSGMAPFGEITRHIGSGDHARNTFIWMTLRYCFYLGGGSSLFILLIACFRHSELDSIAIALKDIWSIFTPILTLALGYAFGKREKVIADRD